MYLGLVKEFDLDYIFLSGWVKQILGLKANKVINIHPGPLGEYGGEKMYGDHVHEKVWRNYFDGKIVSSAVTMHFVPSEVNDKMDTGPIIVQVPVSLVGCTTQKEVKERVNQMEHKIQWQITEHVINGKITWSGVT
jgi:phosphoribosylglycinamide formyltransferase-1